MATTREGASGRERERERRANPLPLPQQPKKSAPPKATQSQPSSPSSHKPLPNYLKPTISSSLDFSSSRSFRRSNIDRPASSSTDRRRSYDKPPPPAHLQKALNTRPTITRTTSSVKPAPQRSFSSLSSRSAKAPALSTVRSFSAKASPSNSNNSLNKGARKRGPRSATSESSVDFEGRDKDVLDYVIGGEDETRCGSEQQEALSLPEISEMPEQVAVLVVQEAVVVVAKNEDDVPPPQGPSEAVVEVGEKEKEREQKEDDQVAEPVVAEETKSTDKSIEEIVETEDHANQGKGEEENGVQEDSPKVDEKHVVVELEEGSKEGEERCAEAVQVKIESPAIAKAEESLATVKADESPAKAKADESPAKVKVERPTKQMQAGKKGTQQAYNDVIEETASKLMERRNKVRALAGAFETVISLQDK